MECVGVAERIAGDSIRRQLRAESVGVKRKRKHIANFAENVHEKR